LRYNALLERLQNLINRKVSQAELCRVLNIKQSAMGNRQSRDSAFSDDEIITLENHYNVILSPMADYVEIDHIHINPSCGKGTVVLEDAIATPVKIGREIIKDLWHVQNPNVLKLFKASGDSMADTIEDGNILLVDTSRTDYQNGGIYLLTINNDWFIKRLRKRLTGELDVISDNSKYPIETFKPNDDIEVIVKGRVIKNLSRGL
jgi:hypothetical protein